MSSPLRLHVPALATWATDGAATPAEGHALPPSAVRHVQVRRLQPGDGLCLFDGAGLQRQAELVSMGRSAAHVRLGPAVPAAPELALKITLALAVPANDRMDDLVEKATELGVAAIQPLSTQRSVLRLEGERAAKRCAHWQAVAASAAEQCGRAVVPRIEPWRSCTTWLQSLPQHTAAAPSRWLLAPRAAQPARRPPTGLDAELISLSGPEGGLTEAEEAAAQALGFVAVQLGPRILRADTAPLAVLAWLMIDGLKP